MRCYGTHIAMGTMLVVAAIAGCAQQSGQQTAANQDGTPTTQVSGKADTETHVANRPALKDATLGDEMVAVEAEHPEEVPVGSSYTYRLKVTNKSSDKTFHGVVLKQQIVDGFTIENSEPEQNGDSTQEAQWNLVSLKPGETKIVSVTATSDQEGTAHLCLGVDYTPAVCVTAKFVKPEIQITKQAPREANVCSPITVTYTISNTGSGAAENVVLVDDLDDGLVTFEGEKQIRQELGVIPSGESREASVKVVAEKTGEFGTRATAMLGNDKEVRSNSVKTVFRAAALDLTFDGPDAEYIKRPLAYRLNVKNTGNAVAHNARVTVELPKGVDVVRMGEAELNAEKDSAAEEVAEAVAGTLAASQTDEGHLQWRIGNLASGQEASMRFTAVSQIAADELKFQSVAAFVCAGEAKEQVTTVANTQTKIIALPALLVFAVDNEDPIKVSGEVAYTIGVLNQGDARDANVQVIATLPEQLEFIEAKGPTKGTANGQKVTFEKLKELPAGKQVNWVVRAKAKQEGDVRLSVETTSDGFSKAVTSEEPTRLYKPQ